MNDKSRPEAALESMAADHISIAFFGQMEREIGAESVLYSNAVDGPVIAAEAARTIWVHPRIAELRERRKVDYQPCAARCRQCSTCICSLAYWERSGRPYMGAEAESKISRSPSKGDDLLEIDSPRPPRSAAAEIVMSGHRTSPTGPGRDVR